MILRSRALLSVLMLILLIAFAGTAGAQTATHTPTATNTATPTATPTPNVQGQAERVRQLNAMSRPGGVQLGDLLLALFDGRQSGGGLTVATPATTPAASVDVAAARAMVRGVYVEKEATSAAAITACGNTTGAQYRKCTLCMNQAGTLRFTPGAVASSQAAALKPACADSETELAYIELPPSFTSGTTVVTEGMLKQSNTRASGVTF